MAKTPDDLEAVRIITTALEGFSPQDQERVMRWAREKIGLGPAPQNVEGPTAPQASWPSTPQYGDASPGQARPGLPPKDLKTFVANKGPKSDIQFAATVAYFYRFEAPPEQRKNEIDAEILQDACRLASRKRFKHPRTTLNNAKNLGLLDSGSEAGKFAINTVGENLVAMTLPGQTGSNKKKAKKNNKGKKPASRPAKGKK